MIVKFLYELVFGILRLIGTFLPEFPYDFAPLVDGAEEVGAIASTANGWFPVTTLGLCIGFLFALRLVLSGWQMALFIYARIPGKAT